MLSLCRRAASPPRRPIWRPPASAPSLPPCPPPRVPGAAVRLQAPPARPHAAVLTAELAEDNSAPRAAVAAIGACRGSCQRGASPDPSAPGRSSARSVALTTIPPRRSGGRLRRSRSLPALSAGASGLSLWLVALLSLSAIPSSSPATSTRESGNYRTRTECPAGQAVGALSPDPPPHNESHPANDLCVPVRAEWPTACAGVSGMLARRDADRGQADLPRLLGPNCTTLNESECHPIVTPMNRTHVLCNCNPGGRSANLSGQVYDFGAYWYWHTNGRGWCHGFGAGPNVAHRTPDGWYAAQHYLARVNYTCRSRISNHEPAGVYTWRGLGWTFGYTHGGCVAGVCTFFRPDTALPEQPPPPECLSYRPRDPQLRIVHPLLWWLLALTLLRLLEGLARSLRRRRAGLLWLILLFPFGRSNACEYVGELEHAGWTCAGSITVPGWWTCGHIGHPCVCPANASCMSGIGGWAEGCGLFNQNCFSADCSAACSGASNYTIHRVAWHTDNPCCPEIAPVLVNLRLNCEANPPTNEQPRAVLAPWGDHPGATCVVSDVSRCRSAAGFLPFSCNTTHCTHHTPTPLCHAGPLPVCQGDCGRLHSVCTCVYTNAPCRHGPFNCTTTVCHLPSCEGAVQTYLDAISHHGFVPVARGIAASVTELGWPTFVMAIVTALAVAAAIAACLSTRRMAGGGR
uniref:Structural polyprotein n=1 Tax=Guangdong chinese water snake rubivirus TaxID=2116472 RepID=A0A2P1GNN8_9VIRU|nr:structural polyprotein [Guangdong chinese water snake rubivirus]